MSDYDYDDQPGINLAALLLNILTVIVLLATICLGSVFAVLLINPQSSLNPFPPEPLPTRVSTWTPSPPAAQQLLPTWTPLPPTSTLLPTETATPRPTLSPTPTVTPFVLISQTAVAVTGEASSSAPFILKGEPLYVQNFTHRELGCSWMGIAGQAFDLAGSEIVGLQVKLNGTLAGVAMDLPPTLTGLARAYGEGGYEITIGDKPIASTGTLRLQLLSQAGLPLSEEIPFDTFDSCEKNLILISFQQVRQP